MNDKQATPELEPGFYHFKMNGEWTIARLTVEGGLTIGRYERWGVLHPNGGYSSGKITEGDEIGERIERQTPDGGWVDVREKPLIFSTGDGWVRTEAGESEFIAAVPYTENGKSEWWIKHCVLEEDMVGLYVVGDLDNEPAGWDINDVTHYWPLPPPPQRVETNNP